MNASPPPPTVWVAGAAGFMAAFAAWWARITKRSPSGVRPETKTWGWGVPKSFLFSAACFFMRLPTVRPRVTFCSTVLLRNRL